MALTGYNISMFNSAYASGNYNIILSWGAPPQDPDAHWYVPSGGAGYLVPCDYGVCLGDGVGNSGFVTGIGAVGIPFAYLDSDNTNGNGPETIVYDKGVGDAPHYAGNHRFFIKNFWAPPTAEFKPSNAVVRVYNESTLIRNSRILLACL